MGIFYTMTNNLSGPNAEKQEIVGRSARALGYDTMSLFRFADQYDTDWELRTRMQAITAAVTEQSVVILQYPSMVSIRYDNCLVNMLKSRKDVQLIIFVEDLGSEVYQERYPELSQEIELFNRCDLLILPSPEMRRVLKEFGLQDIPVMYQEVWDYPYPVGNVAEKIHRSCESRTWDEWFWTQKVESAGISTSCIDRSVYECMCNPLSLGKNIARGIPMIALKQTRAGAFIGKYSLGFLCDQESSEQEIVAFTEQLSQEQVDDVRRHIGQVRAMITCGIFTRTLLQDAVFAVMSTACQNSYNKFSPQE